MRKSLLLTAMIVAAPTGALAQSPLITDRDRNAGPAPAAAMVRPPPPAPATVQGAPDINLARVVIEGQSPPGIKAAWSRMIGQPLTPQTIRATADAVSEAYRKSGLAFYMVQVPDQDFASGVLRLRALSGHIEEVVFGGDTQGDLSLVRAYGAHLIAEQPLSRRTLERYVSLIRDTPGLRPDIQLLQGQNPDAVKLGVGIKRQRNEIAYTLTTRAQPLLGENQLQADWTLNGLLRQGDQTRLTGGVSADLERYRYVSLAHGQPLGSDGARIQAYIGHLRTRPKRLPIKGAATSAGLSFSYPVIRSYQTNLSLSAGVDGLNSDSAVFGATPATERTRVLRAQAALSRQTTAQTIGLGLSVADGVDGLGARVNPVAADAGFIKLSFNAGLDRRFGSQVVLRLRGMAQFTQDALPSSEQAALGGEVFGRAFDTAFLTADRGRAISAELAWTPKAAKTPRMVGLQDIYLFTDAGVLTRNARPTLGRASDHLSSAGGGVRVALGSKFAIGVEGARPVDRPAGFEREGTRWSVTLKGAY